MKNTKRSHKLFLPLILWLTAFIFTLFFAVQNPAWATEKAVLAGGCFWGMEEVLRKVGGVTATTVGYSGGDKKNPTYKEVSEGKTGFAESIEVIFDPKKLSYEDLLKIFFRMHDPTTKNRQGNDIGTQYRSAIFFIDDSQKKSAEKIIAIVNKSKKWKQSVATEVTKFKNFYKAEDYHQKYLVKNPHGYSDHFLRDFKFD